MRPQQDIAFRLSDPPDNVPAAAAEILHLDVTSQFLELLRNILGSRGRARSAGVPALACRIGEPCDVRFQSVDGDGRYGEECDEDGRQEYRKFACVHRNPNFVFNATNATTY